MSRPAGLSRRRLLQAGALGAAALLLGCREDPAGPGRAADAAVLADLHARELALAAALAPAGGRMLARVRRQAARLDALLRARGGTVAAAATPARGGGAPPAAAQAALAAHVDAVGRLGDGDLRAAVLELVTADAEHAAALRARRGGAPAPDAFAGLV